MGISSYTLQIPAVLVDSGFFLLASVLLMRCSFVVFQVVIDAAETGGPLSFI